METTALFIAIRLFLRLLLGSILLCSGVAKLMHPHRAAYAIRDYKIFPPILETFSAFWLAMASGMLFAEIVAGLGLISGFFIIPAIILAICLFVLFSSAIIVNLRRGRKDLSCHCMGILGEHRISWWLVSRNGLFIAGTCFLFSLPPDPFTLDHLPMLGITAWVNTALPIVLIVGALLVVFALFNAARMFLRM